MPHKRVVVGKGSDDRSYEDNPLSNTTHHMDKLWHNICLLFRLQTFSLSEGCLQLIFTLHPHKIPNILIYIYIYIYDLLLLSPTLLLQR